MSDHIETIRGLLEAACAGKESTIRSRKEFGLHFQDEAAWRDKYRAALVWLDTFAVPVDVRQALSSETLRLCIELVEREEYVAGCVDDGISPRLREIWRVRDELHKVAALPQPPAPQEATNVE